MNLPNKLRTMMGHGCTPIYIARKAIETMQPTGIAARINPSAKKSSMQNGAASQKNCFEEDSSNPVHKITFDLRRWVRC